MHYAGDTGQRIANFVRESGSKFAQGGDVFGARHLSAMQALDLLAAFAQLAHHVVEVAAEVTDVVVAVAETNVARVDRRRPRAEFCPAAPAWDGAQQAPA